MFLQILLIKLIFLMILLRYHVLVNEQFNKLNLIHRMMVDQVEIHYQIF
jgi:hypothetical protein